VEAIAHQKDEPLLSANPWDNHQLHIHHHNQFRKTQKFAMLPDEVKMEFELHVISHERFMAEQMAHQQGQLGPGELPPEPGGGGMAPQADPADPPYEMPQEEGGPIEPFNLNRGFTQGMNGGIAA
jgi:hypothetical protein